MKQKTNAREKREAEALRKKQALGQKPAASAEAVPPNKSPSSPTFRKPQSLPDKSPEEEAREFLEYLDRYDTPAAMEEPAHGPISRKASGSSIERLNIKADMPLVSDALDRMHMGLMEMKHSQIKAVKLIHGYGSTGRGGKIRIVVREELAAMKRKGQIRDYIPGEDFGPTDASSRNLVERNRSVSKDPDYGRINHGITIVIL